MWNIIQNAEVYTSQSQWEFSANSSNFMVLPFVEGLKHLKLLQYIQKGNSDTLIKNKKQKTKNTQTNRKKNQKI